jgi:photosystem II stability/assembly factor-like uncharacterized protein
VIVAAAPFFVWIGPAAAHTPHDPISDVALSPSYARDGKVFAISASRVLVGDGMSSTWTELVRGLPRSPESGESIAKIAIAPSDENIIYLSSRVGGVFRSDDGGVSWKDVASGVVDHGLSPARADLTAIAVSPRDADVVLAGGSLSGLYRTADGGAHWQSLSGFRRVGAIAFAGTNRTAFLGDGTGRLLRSDNEGESWAVVARAKTGTFSAIASSGAAVFAGTNTGALFTSTDGGHTFATIGKGVPAESIQSIALSPEYANDHTLWMSTYRTGVYRSTDGGQVWSPSTHGLTTDPQADNVGVSQFRTLTAGKNATGGIVLFEAGFDALFRSTDEGAHWYRVETLGDYVVGLAVSPDYANDSTIAVASYIKGAYLSTDAGAHFERIDNGLEHELSAGNKFAPVKRLHNIVFSPDYAHDNTLFSATWTAFLKSTNRGKSWSQIQVDPAAPSGELRQFVIGIAPGYQTNHTIYLGTRQGEIFRSTDAGTKGTWQRVTNLRVRVRSFAFDPSYSTQPVMLAGTVSGVYRSANAGGTWAKVKSVDTGETMLAISPGFDSDHVIFAASADGLLVSRNAGATWSAASLPSTSVSTVEAVAVSPDFVHDHTLFASVGGVGLFKSTDSGRTFAAVGSDLLAQNVVISDFTNPTGSAIQFSPAYARDHTIFAYGKQDVVRSTDGGATWNVLALPSALDFLRVVDAQQLKRYGPGEAPPSQHSNRTVVVVIVVVIAALILSVALMYVMRSRRGKGRSRPAAGTTSPTVDSPADTRV